MALDVEKRIANVVKIVNIKSSKAPYDMMNGMRISGSFELKLDERGVAVGIKKILHKSCEVGSLYKTVYGCISSEYLDYGKPYESISYCETPSATQRKLDSKGIEIVNLGSSKVDVKYLEERLKQSAIDSYNCHFSTEEWDAASADFQARKAKFLEGIEKLRAELQLHVDFTAGDDEYPSELDISDGKPYERKFDEGHHNEPYPFTDYVTLSTIFKE